MLSDNLLSFFICNDNKKISSAELSIFCGQVALILEAGLPLYDGMETLAGADKESENAEMFRKASEGVTATGSLYEALKSDNRWPEYMVEMVGIGERSGHLESIMRGLESYYAREDRIRSSVVSAVTYPILLSVLLAVIVFILLWRVLPVFRRVAIPERANRQGCHSKMNLSSRFIAYFLKI